MKFLGLSSSHWMPFLKKGYNLTMKPLTLASLDLEALSPAVITSFWLNLSEDALGQPVRLPILAVKGAHPGPVVGLTAALHGDEVNGLPIIHQLFQNLDPQTLAGTLIGVLVANIPAFREMRRRYPDETDLNHILPGIAGDNVSKDYAHRLFDLVVSRFDYLFDLHTASRGRINSLYIRANMDDPVVADMARNVAPEIILHNPPGEKTLRSAAAARGIPAITIEVGNPNVFQPGMIARTRAGVLQALSKLHVLPQPDSSPPPTPSVICSSSFWLYTDRGGLLTVFPDLVEKVNKGDLIARQTDIFGKIIREYSAPEDGTVIGKSTNPVGETGARILHLGIE